MSLPAERIAMTDRRLHRRDVEVYRVALDELDLHVFRELKLEWVAQRVITLVRETWDRGEEPHRPHRNNVHRSLKKLTRHGYLEQEPGEARPRRYRLVHSPPKSQVIISAAA